MEGWIIDGSEDYRGVVSNNGNRIDACRRDKMVGKTYQQEGATCRRRRSWGGALITPVMQHWVTRSRGLCPISVTMLGQTAGQATETLIRDVNV